MNINKYPIILIILFILFLYDTNIINVNIPNIQRNVNNTGCKKVNLL